MSEGFTGACYCGAVTYRVEQHSIPFASLYCHCESCRRAHAAPVYHVVYVKEEDFTFTSGKENIEFFRKGDKTMVTRAFCKICGSKVQNILHNKPWFGFFPSTLDEKIQQNLPSQFQPQMHYCWKEAVCPVERLDPTLPKVEDDPLPA